MALENEGIVQSTRRHGTVVGTPSSMELQEVLKVREAIELAAAKEVLGVDHELRDRDFARLRDLLAKIEDAHKRNEPIEAAKMDFAFHQAIVDFAGNSRFSTITKNMISQHTQHLKGLDMSTWPRVGWNELRRSHHAIVDALEARDIDALSDATVLHYENARRRAVMPARSPVLRPSPAKPLRADDAT